MAAPTSRGWTMDELFAKGGEIGGLLRSFDWPASLPGPIDGWPKSLRSAIGICLTSRQPTCIGWGPRLALIYNDGFRPMLSAKHPWALGRPALEVWPEAGDAIGAMLGDVMERGEPAWQEDRLPLERNGSREEASFTYSYSPILDDEGHVGGVFTTVTETVPPLAASARADEQAARLQAEGLAIEQRRLHDEIELQMAAHVQMNAALREAGQDRERALAEAQAEHQRLHDLFMQAPAMICVLRGPDHVYEMANGPYLQLIGEYRAEDLLGRPVRECVPEVESQGYLKLLDQVYTSGQPFVGQEMPLRLDRTGSGELEEAFVTFVYQPSRNARGEVDGILVHCTDVTEQVRSRQAIINERAHLETLVQHLPLGVMLAEAPSGRLILANEQVGRIMRRDFELADSIDGYATYNAFHRDGRRYRPEELPLSRSISSGEIVTGERLNFERGDGTRGTASVSSAPIRDAAGAIVAGVVTFEDVSESEGRRQRERFLARAGALLAESLDYQTTLQRLAELTVPSLGDWCVVDVLQDGVLGQSLAVAHADPDKVRWARELQLRYPSDVNAPGGVARVLRTGEAALHSYIPPESLEASAIDADHLRLLRQLGMSSAMMVPLTARGHTLGAMSFIAAESGRHYSQGDLAFAQDLAARAALAVDNARLHREQLQARETVERYAHRVEFLADAGQRLISSLDYRQALQELARAVVPELADWCIVDILEGSEPGGQQVAVAHVDPAKEELAREVQHHFRSIAAPGQSVIERVLRTGQPYYVPDIPADLLATSTTDGEHQRLLRDLAPRSIVAVPLQGRARTLGVMSFLFSDSGRRYGPDELAMAQDLGRRTGLAIESALLYAEREAELLQLRQILDTIPAGVTIADTSGRIILQNAAGRSFAWRHWESKPLEHVDQPVNHICHLDGSLYEPADIPLARTVRRGEAISGEQMLMRSPLTGQTIPVLISTAPLLDAAGALVGGIAVYEDITDIKNLERQKDEFLSAAAHDLRTPVTAIRGLVQLLGRRAARTSSISSEQVAETLEQIDYATGKMATLIEELLDLSRRDMNRPLELQRAPMDLVKLVDGVIHDCQRATTEHVLRIETAAPELVGEWDRARMERVIANLLTNAIKYSPAGGPITVSIERDEASGRARVAIRDEGIGIPSADIERIFDRFQRGGNVPGRISGTGIGLAYVRGVVEEHGGSVAAESEEGKGSIFTLTLPIERSS